MKRTIATISFLSLILLTGCGGETVSTSDPAQSNSDPAQTSQPAPVNPTEEATPPPLEINTFSSADLEAKGISGCSTLLKRSAEDDDYVLFEGPELALMKIEGSWVEFSYDPGSAFGDDVRSHTSEDGLFSLRVESPAGERIGYEVSDIPAATIELQLENEAKTVISAVGEIGC